jgi:hypothetical protein
MLCMYIMRLFIKCSRMFKTEKQTSHHPYSGVTHVQNKILEKENVYHAILLMSDHAAVAQF